MLNRVLTARYAYDGLGRMAGTIDPARDGFPPRFLLGRAEEGVIWRFRHDLETERVRGIARLAGREQGFPIAEAARPTRPERLAAIERLLAEHPDDSIAVTHEWVAVEGERVAELWRLD